MKTTHSKLKIAVVSAVMATLAACGANETKEVTEKPMEMAQSQIQSAELYEVHHEGRIFVFYDFALYQDFLKLGETPYMLARIGAGPHGETIKFGLTKQDKKMKSSVYGIDLFDGKVPAPAKFYGEMRSEGRIYVFDKLEDMNLVRKTGEANLRFTEIGAGPKGETVVYVLRKENKKKRPEALIAEFKKHNS